MNATPYLREKARDYNDPKSLIEACIQATGKTKKLVRQAFTDIQKSGHPITLGQVQPHPITFINAPQPLNAVQPQGLSESQLRAKHDVKFIIRNAAISLKKGIFLSDAEFIKLCNISSQQNYRMGLNDAEFNDYHGKAGGITYWSHPESIAQMKQESILR